MSEPARSLGVLCAVAVIVFTTGLTSGCENRGAVPSGSERATTVAGTTGEGTAAAQPVVRPDDWFIDQTGECGVDFTYRTGKEPDSSAILVTVGGGVGLVDYDQDGDLDLFFPGGGALRPSASAPHERVVGLPSRLFRNEGSWQFRDVTALVGLDRAPVRYTHGVAVADYNRDGWPDLLVTGYGGCQLLRNEGGKRLTDVSGAVGLTAGGWFTAAAWGDFDQDGWPDLYAGRYVEWEYDPREVCRDPVTQRADACSPQKYPPGGDRMFRNAGGERFEDVSRRAGLRTDSKALGVLLGEINSDGWLDVYVANDQVANHLYFGDAEGRLTEAGEVSGTAVNEYGLPEGSMGVDFGDLDGDGRGDLFVTNFEMEDNSLYRNLGGGTFAHQTVAMGLAGQGRTLVGWGTGIVDLDGDSWLDVFVLNGHVYQWRGESPYRQAAAVFRNAEGARLDVEPRAGAYFREPHAGRGGAFGDLDNDGAIDLVLVHQDEPATVLRNRQGPENWVRLELRGTKCDREAVGAEVSVPYEGRVLRRFVRSGSGYLSQSDRRILVPCAGPGGIEVEVRWPGGARERFVGVEPGGTRILEQGSGESQP